MVQNLRVGEKLVNTKIVAAYDKKPRYRSVPVGPSMTKQSFQEETNINNILRKYDRETLEAQALQNPGRFLDLPSGLDYQKALNMAINAKASFDALPGTIRAMFENNAEDFLEFMENPENEEEIISLGLRSQEEIDSAADETTVEALEEQPPDDAPGNS